MNQTEAVLSLSCVTSSALRGKTSKEASLSVFPGRLEILHIPHIPNVLEIGVMGRKHLFPGPVRECRQRHLQVLRGSAAPAEAVLRDVPLTDGPSVSRSATGFLLLHLRVPGAKRFFFSDL